MPRSFDIELSIAARFLVNRQLYTFEELKDTNESTLCDYILKHDLALEFQSYVDAVRSGFIKEQIKLITPLFSGKSIGGLAYPQKDKI
jgi:hypothetical protein